MPATTFTTTEAKIEAKVVTYCRKRRLYTRKFASPAHRGVPDRIIVGKGRVLFLELKRPGNDLTTLQECEIAELRMHGAVAQCATGFAEAQTAIDHYFFNERINAQELI